MKLSLLPPLTPLLIENPRAVLEMVTDKLLLSALRKCQKTLPAQPDSALTPSSRDDTMKPLYAIRVPFGKTEKSHNTFIGIADFRL